MPNKIGIKFILNDNFMANLLKIKDLAKERKIPLKALAQEIGMKPEALSTMMRNGTTNTKTLERIAEILSVSPAVFFESKDNDNNAKEDYSLNSLDELRDLISGKNIHHNNINNSKILEKALDEISEHRKLLNLSHENITTITKAILKFLDSK